MTRDGDDISFGSREASLHSQNKDRGTMNGRKLRVSQAVATEDPSERLAMKKGGAGNIKKPGARE